MKNFRDLIKRVRTLFSSSHNKAELHFILSHAKPSAALIDKVIWLEHLFSWIRSSAQVNLPNELGGGPSQTQTVRIRFILQLLERNPHWKILMAATIRSVLNETSGLQLFSQTGLYQESGFISESIDRIIRKLLPAPPREGDLAELFGRVFTHESDAVWITNIPSEILFQILALIQFQAANPQETFSELKKAMTDSLLVLGAKVAAMGLTADIRSRLPHVKVSESSFLRLNQKLDKLVSHNETLMSIDCHGEIEACRKNIQDVFSHLEESGVSVNMVYRLEGMTSSLNRIEILLRLLSSAPDSKRENWVTKFMADLIRENIANKNPGALIQSNLHLLARKIVERAGASGEHYITKDVREYKEMLKSAGGGGLITVITVLIKFVIVRMKLALFFDGLFSWINYSGSFLGMQFLGFTLATKQPSMTAPALAGKLKYIQGPQEVHEFVEEVIRITRSQFAAALGNLGLVIPGAIVFDLIFKATFGHHVVNNEYALHTVESFHPFKTLVIPQAAMTGVILWLSSISGGWLENWVVFRQIPEALAEHRRLIQVFGSERCKKFSRWFVHSISGVGVNLSLGFLLAFVPVAGHFFGLPLDPRHITLSTGALTFAICELVPGHLDLWSIGFAFLGIILIGVLNFGVSFVLALAVALRARQVDKSWIRYLLRDVGIRFRKNPTRFFFPSAKDNLVVRQK